MKHFLPAVIFVTLLPLVKPAAAQAPFLLDSLDLPEAVVIANRDPVARERVGHSYDVLTAKELARLPISSVPEALQYLSGLDLRQRGPRGVQADLSIRGGTFDQAVVLLNGVRLADPQTGHHVMNIPVPLANIERIEVIKGPGARVYGQNAFAGAVNIVTKVDLERRANFNAELGENGLAGFGVSLTVPMKTLRQTFSYQRDLAQGYRENTDYDIQNLFYQAALPSRRGLWGFMAGLSERDFGANGFYASATATQQFESIQTSVVAISHEQQFENGRLTQRLSWRRNQDEYVFVRSNPSIYRNLHISHVAGYDLYRSFNNKLGQLGLAAEAQYVNLASNLLGQRQRGVLNATAEHTFSLLDQRLQLKPGATLSYLSDAGTRLLPGLDATYDLGGGYGIYANTGLTWRIPTYTDLYYEDRFNVGNPDLVAERAQAYELGLSYDSGLIDASLGLWQRDAIDLIDYVRDSAADTVWQPQNITDATFRGVEAQLALRNARKWLPLLRVNYNYIDGSLADPDDAALISRYALEQLTHQLVAAATFRLARPLSLTTTYRMGDRASEAPAEAADVDYQLIDVRADYRLEGFRVFGEVTNLGDIEYSQANGVPLPGRWFRTGVAVELK